MNGGRSLAKPAAAGAGDAGYGAIASDGVRVFGLACDATARGRAIWSPRHRFAPAGSHLWASSWAAPEFGIFKIHADFGLRRLANGTAYASIQLLPQGALGEPVPGCPPAHASADGVHDAFDIVAAGGVEALLRTIWVGRQ